MVAAAGITWLVVFDGDDDGETEETSQDSDVFSDDDPASDDGDDGDDGSDDELTYDPARLTGTWEGTYECASGAAELTLTVDDYPGEDGVAASWDVAPAGGSDAPEGRFYLEGTYADGQLSLVASSPEQETEIDVDEADWLDLEADLSDREDTEVIEATVSGEGCGDVTLERTDTDPWYVGTWSGNYGCTQGNTGASLSIEATGPDTIEGFWEFYDIGLADYEVPYGSYWVEGTYENRSLGMTESLWEVHPDNFASVYTESFDEAPVNPDRFVGVFPDEGGCSVFGLDRVSDEPYAETEGGQGPEGAGPGGESGGAGEDEGAEDSDGASEDED